MQGLQDHQHLDGGTVGIGDNALMRFQSLGIDFRHHQGAALVHAPGRGIVHHHATGVGRVRRECGGGAPAGGKNGQINAVKDVFFQFFHREFALAEGNLAARRTGRGEGPHFCGRELPLVQRLEHFTAHGARGAHNGNSQCLAHGFCVSLMEEAARVPTPDRGAS